MLMDALHRQVIIHHGLLMVWVPGQRDSLHFGRKVDGFADNRQRFDFRSHVRERVIRLGAINAACLGGAWKNKKQDGEWEKKYFAHSYGGIIYNLARPRSSAIAAAGLYSLRSNRIATFAAADDGSSDLMRLDVAKRGRAGRQNTPRTCFFVPRL